MDTERVEVPLGDEWRIPYLHRLLAESLEARYSADTDNEKKLTQLIHSL